MESTTSSSQTDVYQATVLEADLRTVYKVLGRLNQKLDEIPMLDHLTPGEQRNLADALCRAENKMTELAIKIRGMES